MSSTQDRKAYAVEVERDGKFWLVTVPAIDRVTQARNLGEVTEMATDLISIMTEEPVESIAISMNVHMPADAQAHLDAVEELRGVAARATSQAAAESRAAARSLRAAGLTVRDIGAALGVSHQRAHQLLADA